MNPATEDADILAAASRPMRKALLEEAIGLTCGDRNEAYGDPVVNHQHIADIVNATLDYELSANDIAVIMMCVKLARLAKNPTHRDSYVDLMAYAGIAYECAIPPTSA